LGSLDRNLSFDSASIPSYDSGRPWFGLETYLPDFSSSLTRAPYLYERCEYFTIPSMVMAVPQGQRYRALPERDASITSCICFVRESMQEGLKVDNVFQMNSLSSSNRNARTQQPSNIWPIQMQKLAHQATRQAQSEPKDCP
jgi:hypothetical protein